MPFVDERLGAKFVPLSESRYRALVKTVKTQLQIGDVGVIEDIVALLEENNHRCTSARRAVVSACTDVNTTVEAILSLVLGILSDPMSYEDPDVNGRWLYASKHSLIVFACKITAMLWAGSAFASRKNIEESVIQIGIIAMDRIKELYADYADLDDVDQLWIAMLCIWPVRAADAFFRILDEKPPPLKLMENAQTRAFSAFMWLKHGTDPDVWCNKTACLFVSKLFDKEAPGNDHVHQYVSAAFPNPEALADSIICSFKMMLNGDYVQTRVTHAALGNFSPDEFESIRRTSKMLATRTVARVSAHFLGYPKAQARDPFRIAVLRRGLLKYVVQLFRRLEDERFLAKQTGLGDQSVKASREAYNFCLRNFMTEARAVDCRRWMSLPIRYGLIELLMSISRDNRHFDNECLPPVNTLFEKFNLLIGDPKIYQAIFRQMFHHYDGRQSTSQNWKTFEARFFSHQAFHVLRSVDSSFASARHFCSNPYCESISAAAQGMKLCSNCRSVYYCSEVCHKVDWYNHKKYCSRIKEEGPLSLLSRAQRTLQGAIAFLELEGLSGGIKKGAKEDGLDPCDYAIVMSMRYDSPLRNEDHFPLCPFGSVLQPLSDDDAWSEMSALGQQYRDNALRRKALGDKKQVLVECKYHGETTLKRDEHQYYEPVFYMHLKLDWESDQCATDNTKMEIACNHLRARTEEQTPFDRKAYQQMWKTGKIEREIASMTDPANWVVSDDDGVKIGQGFAKHMLDNNFRERVAELGVDFMSAAAR